MEVPALGVGLTYFGGSDPLLERCADRIDVIEVEPQTLWLLAPDGGYRPDREVTERLAAHPSAKLMHGIGFPVGGTRPPDPRQVPPLLTMAEILSPPWMSEHLSFNRATGAGGDFLTGFLLPPRQTPAGVDAAVASIRAMADALPMPLAVETGVTYLAPRPDEMTDGDFVAAVVEKADCGILLDLHNLWANQKNGRQSVEDFLHRIPLDRVWEIHLAGGEERDGYWLDSHSGPVQRELAEMAAEVVPRLPNLGALIFEIFPAHLQAVGLGVLERQIEDLHRLWDRRGRASRANRRAAPATPETAAASDPAPRTDDGPSPRLWEDALGALTVGQPAATPQARELARELAEDPGVAVARNLLGEFRAGMIVRTLKLTGRLLLLTVGPDGFRELLRGYWAQRPPHLFASAEADGFCDYLEDCSPDVPWLQAVAAFERAANATLIDGEYRLVPFPVDPMPLLRALAEGRLPDPDLVRPGDYEVEVTPEDAAAIDVVLGQRLTDTAGSAAPPPPSTARGVAELTSPRIHHH